MAYEYEKGFIRTDRGLFVDKGNYGVDPQHIDFDGGARGDGLHDDRGAFAAADVFASANSVAFAPGAGTYRIGSALTISTPARIARGCMLKPASGVTVTFTHPVDAGHFKWIDTSLGGTVAFERGDVSVSWFGAVGDGSTDDSAAITKAERATPRWALTAVMVGTTHQETVGGGTLVFPPTTSGYYIGSSVSMTNSKLRLKLNGNYLVLANGITGFDFNTPGTSEKQGVVFEDGSIIGGATAIDIGTNAVPQPVHMERIQFIAQTSNPLIVGSNGFGVTGRACRVVGCGAGVLHQGEAADGVVLEDWVFLYNRNYDFVAENGANTFRLINPWFIENLKVSDLVGDPTDWRANVRINMGAGSETVAYSSIVGAKFGQEGRIDGHCVLVVGTGGAYIQGFSIRDSLLHFEQVAGVTNYAIKFHNVDVRGFVLDESNTLIHCAPVDYSTMTNIGQTADNLVRPVSIDGARHPQTLRGGFTVEDHIEPQPWDKINIVPWSRIYSGTDFTLTNLTPSYMTEADENGIAANASKFTATNANNLIAFDINTSNVQKFYTFWLAMKLAVAGDVLVQAYRSNDYAFYRTVRVGATFTRIAIPFYQTYLATGNPYSVNITIPNGGVLTVGSLGCTPGRDVGDLYRTDEVIQRHGVGFFTVSSAAPTRTIYLPRGVVVENGAAASGSPEAWVHTAAGGPGTWVAKPNLP